MREKEPEFLRKDRLKLSKALKTQVVPSKKLHKRKKSHESESDKL